MNTVVALEAGNDLVACIAGLLSQARHDAGLSQRQLAAVADVHHSMIYAYEAGRRHPNITTLTRLMSATGATLHLDINRPS